jgi:phage terminase large subunit GpA-like protein
MSEPEILLSRRENYGCEVPDQAKVIVAAIDTQQSWFEYLVTAAGARNEIWALETGTIEGRIETDAQAMYEELDRRLFGRRWARPDGRHMAITRAFQDSGGHATTLVYQFCKRYARILTAYRGSPDLTSPFKRGTDQSAHARLIQGNSSYFKDSLATRLAITVPGPGFIHFPLDEQAGFDEEFFLQLLSERKEKRKRLGVITTRWIQTRERNEALDLLTMTLCILEMFRGSLDTMQPVIADQTPKDTAPVQFGAQKMIVNDPVLASAFGVVRRSNHTGFGAAPGSGIQW